MSPDPTSITEHDRLQRLAQLHILDTPPEPVLDGVAELAAEMFEVPCVLVTMVGSDAIWVKAAIGMPSNVSLPREGSFCDVAIRQAGVLVVPDAREDARFRDLPTVRGEPHLVHYAGAPLVMPGGERVGTLCLFDHHPRMPDARQARMLQLLAAKVVDVLLLRQSEREAVQRVRAEKALLEAVIEHMPAGLTVFDAGLRHQISNSRVRDFLGLPDDLLAGENVTYATLVTYLAGRGFYGPGPAHEHLRAQEAVIARNHPSRYDRQLPDGRIVERNATRMADGRLVTTYTDVTEARHATARLAEGERRLSMALEAAGMGVWEVDVATGAITVSEHWARDTGLPTTVLDVFARLADHDVPAGLARVRELAIPLLKGQVQRLAFDHRITAPGEAREVWVRVHARVARRDGEGRATHLVGTCSDVTDKVLARDAREAAVAAAQAANQAKSDFLATMSHEIRTPLNGVVGVSRLLAGTRLDALQREYLATIDGCAGSLLGLVDDVLDVSRIEAGKLELREAPVDLPALLAELEAVFGLRARAKGLQLHIAAADGLPGTVLGDRQRLRQVLLNLLGNAVKFTTRGSVGLRVGPTPDGCIAFAVDDSGPGISAADQQRLFERFVQADTSAARRHQGTGLGLAISRGLARCMGGDITLASEPGVGSVFTLTLPLRAHDPVPSSRTAGDRAPVHADARILLVEDNPVNLMVAHGLLEALGYRHIDQAEDGGQAIDACSRQRYDLVLMDCQMPGIDGFEAATQLRCAGHRMPIVALTANATAQDRAHCLAAGMDDYLSKPVDPHRLGAVVAQWLAAGGA